MKGTTLRCFGLLLVGISLLSAYFGAVEVEEGEKVKEVEMMFGEVRIGGTVEKDASCTFCELTLQETGSVGGKVSVAFGDAILNGTMGSVFGKFTNITISGTVQGDVKADYGNLEMKKESQVLGNVQAYRSNVEIAGRVNGSVEVRETSLELESEAEILGQLVLISSNFDGKPEQVKGGIVRKKTDKFPLPIGPKGRAPAPRLPEGFPWLFIFVLTLLTVLLFQPSTGSSQTFSSRQQLLISLLIGFLSLMAFLPICIFLVISLVGIMLIPLVVILYLGAWIFGWAVMCRKTGNWFFTLFRTNVHDLLDTAVGFILLSILVWLPVVGGFFFFLFLMISLGIFYRFLWLRLRPSRVPTPIPTP